MIKRIFWLQRAQKVTPMKSPKMIRPSKMQQGKSLHRMMLLEPSTTKAAQAPNLMIQLATWSILSSMTPRQPRQSHQPHRLRHQMPKFVKQAEPRKGTLIQYVHSIWKTTGTSRGELSPVHHWRLAILRKQTNMTMHYVIRASNAPNGLSPMVIT